MTNVWRGEDFFPNVYVLPEIQQGVFRSIRSRVRKGPILRQRWKMQAQHEAAAGAEMLYEKRACLREGNVLREENRKMCAAATYGNCVQYEGRSALRDG